MIDRHSAGGDVRFRMTQSEADYLRVWQYMEDNPVKWAEDKYYKA